MAGCRRCTLKRRKRLKEKEKKRKRERRKNVFFFLFFFISPCACFFIYAQWSFFKYIKETISRLGRSYPLLFVIKILIVSQFGDLYINLMIHCFAHFDSESLWKHHLLQD